MIYIMLLHHYVYNFYKHQYNNYLLFYNNISMSALEASLDSESVATDSSALLEKNVPLDKSTIPWGLNPCMNKYPSVHVESIIKNPAVACITAALVWLSMFAIWIGPCQPLMLKLHGKPSNNSPKKIVGVPVLLLTDDAFAV